MRYVMLVLVPAVALLMAADDQADKDKKALQGTWQVISFENRGEAVPEEMAKKMKVVFKDDTMTLSADNRGRTETGKFKLDPSKKPKALDVTPLEKGNVTALFIYEIDGDTLKLCWNKPGGERPKEFAGKDKAGYMVLKREK
jgi:uncharacterized protein (TIGR03067 family)